MFEFGLGKMVATPASTASDLTPIELAVLQDLSMGFSWDKKELYGRSQFPVKEARSKGKIDCKASWAQLRPAALNLILNAATTTGMKKIQDNEAQAVPASTPFTITIAPPNSGTFSADLGVVNATTGIPLKLVAATPTTGQYMVDNTGKYTFASADTALAVLISYEYSLTTTGTTLTITNQIMGTAPVFGIQTYTALDGKQIMFKFPCCTSTKLDLNMKLDDFLIPDFDFSVFANPAGIIGYGYIEE